MKSATRWGWTRKRSKTWDWGEAMPLMFERPRVSTRPNPYAKALSRHPRPIDPYGIGGLAGLGETRGPTGIAAVDAFILDANAKADRLVLATEIGTVCSVIGAVAGLMMVVQNIRGRR